MQEFQPGDSINNRYKVTRKLGAGAMGSVYLCEDGAENNIKVALKVLISDNLDDQDVWAKGEYEALTRLKHPNLAKVHNFGRIEGTKDYFIVSEFIKGVDLYSATEYLKYDEIVEIVVQVCRALEYIHSQGYVHFDVKPDNILVSRQKTLGLKEGSKVQYDEADLQCSQRGHYDKPVAKLIDFGLAEKITGSFSFAIKGTLNYLAPEILNGSTPDKRADLYSLGVTIYQVVNRDLPFHQDVHPFSKPARSDNRAELFEANLKKHPEYFRGLIMRLLAEQPEERFQSAKEAIQYINRESEHEFELETEETRASYFYSPRLVGRKKEINLLKQYYEMLFFPRHGLAAEVADRPADRPDASPDEGQPAIEDEIDAEVSTDHEETARGDVSALEEPSQFLVVSGQMGSGKSRLLEEFQHFLKLNDISVYRGNCYEGNQKAYQPFIEILRELVCAIGPESDLFHRYEDSILRLLPEFAGKDFRPRPQGSRGGEEKQRFIDRLSEFLVDAAEKRPYVFVVNNLHWVDDASVDLLANLFERMRSVHRKGQDLKLLALASIRAEELQDDRLRDTLDGLKESGFCVEVAIRRLKRPQITEFLQSMLGITDVPEDFVSQLEEQTGGNPLFLVETLKALEDDGIIKHHSNGWSIKTTKYSRVEIPHCMEDLLQNRLDKLESTKRQVLEVMAVLDKPVSGKFLQQFKRFADAPILVELRDLEASGMVQKLFENGKLHFQIEQPKVREILYAQLDRELRARYHAEVGEAFEEAYRHREEEILEELAYHYQRSDRAERAVELAQRAGDRLKAIYANERAAEYYTYVLEQVADSPEHINVYFDVREKLGDICTTMGRYDEAVENYEALLMNGTREMLPAGRVIALYLSLGKVSEIQGDYERALHQYKDARNFLSTVNKDDRLFDRARVYNGIGWVYVCMGKYEKAMTISLEALRVIQKQPEQIEHAMVYGTIGSANFFKGNIKEAVKYQRMSLQIKEHLEDIPEIIASLNSLGEAYLAGAEYGEAIEHFRRALTTSEEIGDPYGRAVTLHNIAHLYCAVGRLDDATKYLEDSIEQSKSYNMRHLSLRSYVIRGMLLTERKEYSKAESNFFRVLTAYSKQGNRAGLCSILLRMAAVHRLNGKFDEAGQMAEEARRYAEDMGIQVYRAKCCLEEARLERFGASPDYARAVTLLEEGVALAAKVEHPELLGELNFELAETLVNMREVGKATQYYKAAEDRFREIAESLPEDFRASYEEAQRKRFPNWSAEDRATANEDLPAYQDEEVEPDPPAPAPVASAESSLRMVSELMQSLPASRSLEDFLVALLDKLFDATGARVGYVLSLSGRSLSITASHHRLEDADRVLEPSKVLCLDRIDRALKEQQAVLIETIHDEPEVAKQLEEAGLDCQSLGIFPFLEPDGKRGALYLLNPAVEGNGNAAMMLIQPFLNLIPVSYMHFQSQVA